MVNRKVLLGIGLAVALFGAAACGDSDDAGNGETGEAVADEEVPGQEDIPQPDIEGIPDIVATVNGQDILKEEFVTTYEAQFEQMAMQSQMSGEPVDEEQLKEQTAENMINSELLNQEAENRGVEVSESDLDETLEELATENGLGSADEFMAALNEQGMEEEEIMSQLETQVRLDSLITEEAGDIEPTEEELQELYDQAEAQQEELGEEGSELPPFDEVKPQLEEQAKADKESEVVQALIGDLRENADVTVNLS
ncbi:SurA N-terminal domain-containing protein [Phytoactinopolyspora mesophila]|uniref:peptidylprolyl isomerase n=1 Tax=Phytoactinopolyspora mesophila TaxID=2650750 RepID=A0A7K3M1G1_9ACTN|nr:SurA N-terminal domain-containing protein [Phytoactinopolyspora mesophila]NDL57133.1 peptidylprolyl isomerase [Phytoactinopolyspora mesophila]